MCGYKLPFWTSSRCVRFASAGLLVITTLLRLIGTCANDLETNQLLSRHMPKMTRGHLNLHSYAGKTPDVFI